MSDTRNPTKSTNMAKTVARDASTMQGISRPKVGASTHQAADLVIDTSGSMMGTKIGEAHAAMLALVQELGDPKNRGAFHVAMIAYGDSAKIKLQEKPASDVRPEELALTVGELGGQTNITAGLAAALKVVEAADGRDGNWQRPIVILMTDGHHNVGAAPDATATALKQKADIIAVAFGSDADFASLQRLATSPQHAVRCTNGAELRQYFAHVARTMSQSQRTGQNAAALLGSGSVVRSH